MHETRNFIMVLLLLAGAVWSFLAWFVFASDSLLLVFQRATSTLLFLSMAVWLVYALKFEDKLPDHLGELVGKMHYGVDGIDIMPTIRTHGEQTELCVYYQNRYENPAQVIVHLRPPEDCFIIRPGLRDVHFAFMVGGGDFGVIRQPIAVPEHLQGEVIDIKLAAASFYARSHGARLRKDHSIPCSSLLVDWGGSAFKTGVHEVSGEIELQRPTTFHLSMPKGVIAYTTGSETWRQECMEVGVKRG